jgi:hypothetical protein
MNEVEVIPLKLEKPAWAKAGKNNSAAKKRPRGRLRFII